MSKYKFLFSITLVATIAPLYAATTFGIIGDFGANNSGAKAVAKSLKQKKPDFIITVGDNNYPRGCEATIDDNIGQHYFEYIGNYHGKYGTGATDNAFFPTLGNHDWDAKTYCPSGKLLPYQTYFTLPGNTRYYDFVKDNVHFFALDSDPREPDGITKGSKQYKWLQQKAAASTATFKIAYFHHAPYSSSYHGNNHKLQWDFANLGIDVVLAGHDHMYERIERDNILYIVNGIGGADENYRVWKVIPGSKFIYNKKYGYMLANIENNRLSFKLYSQDNELIDQRTIEKKQLPNTNKNDYQ